MISASGQQQVAGPRQEGMILLWSEDVDKSRCEYFLYFRSHDDITILLPSSTAAAARTRNTITIIYTL